MTQTGACSAVKQKQWSQASLSRDTGHSWFLRASLLPNDGSIWHTAGQCGLNVTAEMIRERLPLISLEGLICVSILGFKSKVDQSLGPLVKPSSVQAFFCSPN